MNKSKEARHPSRQQKQFVKAASRTAEELTRRNVSLIAHLEEAAKREHEPGERIAVKIANFSGSFKMVWIHLFWFAGWILANSLLPISWRFDPFPFSFLTLVVSLEAIFLSMFILITQNRQMKMSDRCAHLDLQLNLLSEQENTKMLELLDRIATKLGVAGQADPDLSALEEPTSPGKLMDEIDRSQAKAEELEKKTSKP